MRPITPITYFTSELGWHVRLCPAPEIGRPLPAETRDLRVAITRHPAFDQNTIFATFALGFIPRDEDIADFTVKTQTYRSTPPSIFQSDRAMWIEMWKDDCRGVIPARM
eukprot:4709039-Pleurochrysis_carterae.AAC.1